ncbi:MAG: type II toxin-antitoxin system PemK/MazF family toxin [Roseivirga sp.]|jgi:mRNA interferase MazF|uniref:type II toxin-antitoxin system PemK/MazF family toxin n=1 Tax=Roseivirga sp. TaxID=1964215 RepID=UPI001B1EFDB6|nr:type II toxin-antitoxin system PemK/MazF family toxin [Roseivirga sp.]MBO6495702.1 type II toxin-antitoxin system PemK/MazF family toxin [Roseivirga sp.]
MIINQYEIVLVNLDPTIGSEIKKTRPCLVISPNEINHNLRTVTIAPLTSTSKPYPTRVPINHNQRESWVVIDQIRTIDKARIVKQLGDISSAEIAKVKSIIKETFID